ncbi:MAG: SprT family zinc-dependent metalloprotease [Synergistota bacterium]|nr:SprT family zinc-dependent metalloprotease [Synergistota bacterium]
MKETLSINSIDFEVRRSIRRKRISVGLDPTAGAFYIAAPTRLSVGEISRTLLPQIEGLMKRIKKSENRIIPQHEYKNGEKFFYKGVEYPLKRVVSDDNGALRLEEGTFYIDDITSGSERKIFETWYKRALYEEIRGILPQWTKIIKVNPNSVNIKTVKSIWGSCSAKGSLTFSTRLALVPPELLEYVVAHELCHMRHMDHSAAFWQELTGYISDCRERRKCLRESEYLYKWW